METAAAIVSSYYPLIRTLSLKLQFYLLLRINKSYSVTWAPPSKHIKNIKYHGAYMRLHEVTKTLPSPKFITSYRQFLPSMWLLKGCRQDANHVSLKVLASTGSASMTAPVWSCPSLAHCDGVILNVRLAWTGWILSPVSVTCISSHSIAALQSKFSNANSIVFRDALLAISSKFPQSVFFISSGYWVRDGMWMTLTVFLNRILAVDWVGATVETLDGLSSSSWGVEHELSDTAFVGSERSGGVHGEYRFRLRRMGVTFGSDFSFSPSNRWRTFRVGNRACPSIFLFIIAILTCLWGGNLCNRVNRTGK